MTGPAPHPLRVGVNLCWLVPGDVGGTEEYATRLLGEVAGRLPLDIDVTLFALPGLADAHPGLADRYPVVTAPTSGRRRPERLVAESTWLAAQARRHRLHLMHHLGGTVPILRGAPAVVTIHDLQPLAHPEHFSAAKARYLSLALPAAVRAARLVVAISDFTARDVEARLGTDPAKVRVVRHGFTPPEPLPAAEQIEAARRRHGLAERWLVYPAVAWPHKGHRVLLDAFEALAAAEDGVDLVLTGGPGPLDSEVDAAIARPGLAGRVHRLGRVPRAELDALMAGAAGVPSPSMYEGFGAPVLEAMALGTPVAAARAGALPEVVGDAALLVAPTDTAGWTAAMTRLLHDHELADRLVAAGHERVAAFDWAGPADAQVAVWREAAA